MLTDVELPGEAGTVQLPSPPIKFTETPTLIYRRPPLLDEHRNEILAEAGIAEDELPARKAAS